MARVTPLMVRMMNRIELIEFGRLGEREHRIAADELFRRTHDKLVKAGKLSPAPEERAIALRLADRQSGERQPAA